MAISFSVEKAGEVRVELKTAKPGLARVRNARINVGRLNSSSVALDGGRTLGSIVLPEDATDAEQYAAWELQKYIFQMTGKTPGVTGRDETDNGVRIRIGRAVGEETLARLDGLDLDSYIITNRQDAILLAGNNDRGTLYAAYDFLKKQGCGWYWPGPSGEVVPQRRSLRAPDEIQIESPDFLLRGLDNKRPDWDHGSWRAINEDDYIDWCVRNRMNAALLSAHGTIDFGKWRGGSYVLRTNHTMGIFWWKDGKPIKPEWAPLVAGQRKPLHHSKRRNPGRGRSRNDRTSRTPPNRPQQAILRHSHQRRFGCHRGEDRRRI